MAEIMVKRRNKILEWVKEINECFEWSENTIETTMRLFDSQVANNGKEFKPGNYQREVTAIMFIVSKAYGESVSCAELADMTDGLMNADELKLWERQILRRMIDDATTCELVPKVPTEASETGDRDQDTHKSNNSSKNSGFCCCH